MDEHATTSAGWQPSFPGLELDALDGRSSAIEKSAVATIRALDAAGLLSERHALTCQLIVELARAVGRGLSYGKVSVATSTLAKQLLDAIASLPQPPAVVDDDAAAFERLSRELAAL